MNKKGVSTAVLVVLAVLAWLTVVPEQFGGPATYVRIRGESMLPTFEPGDLVMLHQHDEYAVGDVIAFRARSMGDAVLIHRVTGMDETGTRYLTQGDNRDYIDNDHPLPEDVLGAMVVAIPSGGRASGFVQSPVGFGVLAALAAASLVMGGPGHRRRRTHAHG